MAEPLAAGRGAGAREALLILGLWAHAAEDVEHGARRLRAAADPAGRFEDWRLLVLADCYKALGQLPAAEATLRRLLEEHPASPLRGMAILRAIRVAGAQGNRARALQLLQSSRGEALPGAKAEELETAAWHIAAELGDLDLQRRLARRLLVHFPIVASKLQVIELFRQPSGAIEWLEVLTTEQLVERARSLLGVGVTAGALEALEAVPSAHRDPDWSLLLAAGLTADRRGREALAALASFEPRTAAQSIELEERRAAAAFEAARARAGRTLPSAAERERFRRTGREALWRVVELSGDEPAHRQASLRAQRRLLSELVDEELVEVALGLLRTLSRLDPTDTVGARFLWQWGWREYRQRNYTGAIGYWSELESIYPRTGFARSGRYWSGRAHESLGNRRRAEGIYHEIASADSQDFYSRHARARLAEDPGGRRRSAPERPREPWPWNSGLARARWLSDRGLDDLALAELRALAGRVEPRSASAFEAIVLARQGKPRESIHALSRAFPQLGSLGQASAPEAALRLYYPIEFEEHIRRFAAAHRIPRSLLFAMIRQESAFDADAVSRAGARGLMQLMPSTGRELARRLGLSYSTSRLTDPEFNIRLGSKYFRQMLEMFEGNQELALAGYNGGPYRIQRLWRSEGSARELDLFLEGLDMEETKRYVKRILLFSDSYRRLYQGRV